MRRTAGRWPVIGGVLLIAAVVSSIHLATSPALRVEFRGAEVTIRESGSDTPLLEPFEMLDRAEDHEAIRATIAEHVTQREARGLAPLRLEVVADDDVLWPWVDRVLWEAFSTGAYDEAGIVRTTGERLRLPLDPSPRQGSRLAKGWCHVRIRGHPGAATEVSVGEAFAYEGSEQLGVIRPGDDASRAFTLGALGARLDDRRTKTVEAGRQLRVRLAIHDRAGVATNESAPLGGWRPSFGAVFGVLAVVLDTDPVDLRVVQSRGIGR